MARTLDEIYIEEKHMPGQHDQTTHAGAGAAGVRQDTRTKTPPTTAKVYREQLLKQRSALATQLEKAKKPEQQAELTKQLKELDNKIKQVPAPVQMTQAKHDTLMRNRSVLATEMESLANRSGPKSDARKAQLKLKIAKIDAIVRENPLPKKKPKTVKPVVPKPTTPTPPVAAEPAAVKQGLWDRAKSWLSNLDTKIGDAFSALEKYPLSKINEIADRVGQRREVLRKYDDWNRKQARASNTLKQLQQEYKNRQGKSGIPSRKFYDLAVRLRTEQVLASAAKNSFERMSEFSTKSMVDDKIDELESPYDQSSERTDNVLRSQ